MRQRPPLGLTDDKHEERAALAKCIIALARNGPVAEVVGIGLA